MSVMLSSKEMKPWMRLYRAQTNLSPSITWLLVTGAAGFLLSFSLFLIIKKKTAKVSLYEENPTLKPNIGRETPKSQPLYSLSDVFFDGVVKMRINDRTECECEKKRSSDLDLLQSLWRWQTFFSVLDWDVKKNVAEKTHHYCSVKCKP